MKIKLSLKRLRAVLVLLAVLAVLYALFRGLQAWERVQGEVDLSYSDEETGDSYADEDQTVLYRDGSWYAARDDMETVLLMGLDKYEEAVSADSGSYFNHQQADLCLLLIVDHGNEMCYVLHINRDSMTYVHVIGEDGQDEGVAYEQLALAHTYGTGGTDSCENTVMAVSDFLYGTKIDHYISLTMDAVAAVNDQVGGVSVEIMDDFTVVDETMVEGTTVTLSGEQALTYVRARGALEDSTNTRRMERQRQYLQALFSQAESRFSEDDELLINTMAAIAPYMVTDCTVDQLSRIADCVLEYGNEGIQTIEGEAVKGEKYIEFYPDEDALKAQLLDLFYEEVPAEK